MVRKGMLLVTDMSTKGNGWLPAFEGERKYERRLTTTSNLSVKYDFWSYIVLGRNDTSSSAWLAINACRASQKSQNSELPLPSSRSCSCSLPRTAPSLVRWCGACPI